VEAGDSSIIIAAIEIVVVDFEVAFDISISSSLFAGIAKYLLSGSLVIISYLHCIRFKTLKLAILQVIRGVLLL
jgi:hypothetical protein